VSLHYANTGKYRSNLYPGPLGKLYPIFSVYITIPEDCPTSMSLGHHIRVFLGWIASRQVDTETSLLYWRTAEDGTTVELGPGAKLEVRANNADGGEAAVWEVDGKPLVIRRKRRLLGAGLATVTRVGEAPQEE